MSPGRLALAAFVLALLLIEVGGCVSAPKQLDYPPLIFNPRRKAITLAEAADSGLTLSDLEAAVLPDGGVVGLAPGGVPPPTAYEAGEAPPPVELDPRCGPEIRGARALLQPGAVILLGEEAGTEEIPRFVARLACHGASLGRTVHVGLEIAQPEQRLLRSYLASAGTESDRQQLLAGGMWNRPYEDGRTSEAMLRLIEQLREWRSSGMAVDAFYFWALGEGGTEKEALMARNILEERARAPWDVYLVLTGNVHARTRPGVDWDRELRPMGYFLQREVPDLVSLNADWTGGKAWTCILKKKVPRCGTHVLALPRYKVREQDLPRTDAGTQVNEPFMGLWPEPTEEGYHGLFHVGELTPSPPANPLNRE
jgi:hypothetical protein